MREEFLHYVWRLQRFDQRGLKTTNGETIEILDNGLLNQHDGPDFINAKLRIAGQLWAGNIEIHLNASDWYHHQHDQDPNYDNVILHVVAKADQQVLRTNHQVIPCLELWRRIPSNLLGIYQQLSHNEAWIPCQAHLPKVPELTRSLWLDRMLVERLEYRTNFLERLLVHNKLDWEETFFQAFSRGLGQKANADAFLLLAQRLSTRVIARQGNDLSLLEALIFGQAGFLEQSYKDDYPRQLKTNYKVLRAKHQLEPMRVQHWKFKGLRPANFPTIRLAQLAALMAQKKQLLSKTLAAANVQELNHMLAVEATNYWRHHYVFDKETKSRIKRLGAQSIQLLIINTIAPFLFFYGKYRQQTTFQDKALALLEELKPERNSILSKWEQLGVIANAADQSQALLQLKIQYCEPKRCTECAIGHVILNEFSNKK